MLPPTLLASMLLAATAMVPLGILPEAEPRPHASVDPVLATALHDASPDEPIGIIVETRDDPRTRTTAAELLGADIAWTYRIIPAFSATATPDQVQRLAAQPWVTHIWADRPTTTLMDVSTQDIEATHAWAANVTGAGVTVAVLDTGLDLADPDLAGGVVACVAAVAGLTLPECTDTNGHGTHVAGTVASRDPTYPGVAPDASLAIVRVLHAGGAGTTSDIIGGMQWIADNRGAVDPPIRVATMSIGSANPGCGDGTDPEARAADALVALGVTFSIAAGNSGHETCTVDGASAAFNVTTVGAADDRDTPDPHDDTLAPFSSGGPTTDGRLKPELVAPGVGIRSAFLGPTTASLDGTSMATPHVAGVAALLLQQEPDLTPGQTKARLIGGTLAPAPAGTVPNDDWGHGLLNACRTLRLEGCTGGSLAHASDPTAT